MNAAIFQRLELLLGQPPLAALAASRVIVFGVGGVGSWCAEALVRNGVGTITIVDSDQICVTNVNRQLMATSANIGKVKVFELRDRLLAINPALSVTALQKIYDFDTADEFDLASFDYVIDAIDSLSCKVELIIRSLASGAVLFSSLGAGGRIDASKIRTSSIWDSHACRLGHFVRKRLRHRLPNRAAGVDFHCVFSIETPVDPFPSSIGCGTGACLCPKTAAEDSQLDPHEWCSLKKQINGSAVHITATFGMFLAGLVVQDIVKKFGHTADTAIQPVANAAAPSEDDHGEEK